MRCNKCNSPLINNEEFCKICGAKVEVEKTDDFDMDLEIIDLDDIKDDNVGNEEADSFNSDMEIADDEYDKDEPMSQTLIDIMMRPIVLEADDTDEGPKESKQAKEEPIIEKTVTPTVEPVAEKTVELPVEDEIPAPTMKPAADEYEGEKEIIKPEPIKKETKTKAKMMKNFEDKAALKKIKLTKIPNKKADLTILILAIILIASIILNVYLFVTKNNDGNEPSNTTTIIKTNTSLFNGHEVAINNGWIIKDDTNSLLLYDSTGTWNSFISFVNNINYNDIKNNVEKITESMKEAKYQFSSHFEKEVNKQKLYVFKGKKDSETAFLIFRAVNKNTLTMTELTFKAEVNETTLDAIYDTVSTIKVSNNVNNDNIFEHSKLADILRKTLTEE